MPRRGRIAKRDVLPDPVYNSKLVTRLINNIMYDGKKGVAQKIVYGAFDIVKEKTGKDPLEAFEQSMENIMPVLEVKADPRSALDHQLFQKPRRKDDERASGRGDHGRAEPDRRRGEKTRGYPQDGGCKQSVCTLPLVMRYGFSQVYFIFHPAGSAFAEPASVRKK